VGWVFFLFWFRGPPPFSPFFFFSSTVDDPCHLGRTLRHTARNSSPVPTPLLLDSVRRFFTERIARPPFSPLLLASACDPLRLFPLSSPRRLLQLYSFFPLREMDDTVFLRPSGDRRSLFTERGISTRRGHSGIPQ